MKKAFFFMFMAVLVALAFELISFAGLLYLKRYKALVFQPALLQDLSTRQRDNIRMMIQGRNKYLCHHPVLGWSIKPNGEDGRYRANAAGLRADREYTPFPVTGTTRIASFGESFTHGDEVSNDETWEAVLESLDPRLEVLNFGVPGYGIDQAFLRYLHEGRSYHPDIVVIGMTSESPFRSVNIFRPFYSARTGLPFSKPRYMFKNGQLTLVENPLKAIDDYARLMKDPKAAFTKMLPYDHSRTFYYSESWMDRSFTLRLARLLAHRYFFSKRKVIEGTAYDPESEVFRVTAGVLEKFYTTVEQDGATPVIVIFPTIGDLSRIKAYHIRNYDTFLDLFRQKGWRYLDMTEELMEDPRDWRIFSLYAAKKHLSPLGNRCMAEYLYRELKTSF